MDEKTLEQAAFDDIWMLVCDLAQQAGVTPLNKLPCPWRCDIDKQWKFWINGTNTEKLVKDLPIPAFSLYVEFNGWPAGILNPHGGEIAAGEAANIFTFRDALRRKVDL